MKYFPLFHNLQGRSCLIVGGGTIATRRAAALLGAGARVDVIAPQISEALQQTVGRSGGQLISQVFAPELVQREYLFILAATDQPAVNQLVCAFAASKGIAVNVVDDRLRCDFIFPSVLDRDPLTIAVSSNGSSPLLSRLLRQQLDKLVPAAYGELASFVGRHRQEVRRVIPDTDTRISFWEHVLQGAIAEAIFAGKDSEATYLLDEALKNPQAFNRRGEVYLIGAGPGDPELLTLRAWRLLQQADVVLYDRLVSEPIMALLPADTERVYVGKQRANHSLPQGGINQLLVDYARQGKRVARLKGGDPFVFGRGGEEIESLVDERIAFQVVPGITAANGCSAYAGIPLTHRDYAQSVQFVTGQLQDGTINLNWTELVVPGKTLVFYMGLRGLAQICQALVEHGMRPGMPVALIEKGTTPQQRVLIATLQDLPARLAERQVTSPSLFIVGEVVCLAERLAWYQA